MKKSFVLLFALLFTVGMIGLTSCSDSDSGQDAAEAEMAEGAGEADGEGMGEADGEGEGEGEEEGEAYESISANLETINREVVFQYTDAQVEMKPTTVKCADSDKEGKRTRCFENAVRNHLKANVAYPEAAEQAGVQGSVHVQFVVDEEGNIADVTMLKGASVGAEDAEAQSDLYSSLNDEALRVVGTLPQMAAGTSGGNPVSVAYVVPVSFVLN
ncbi:MAG: energy transducer TonB [Bacteroidota bacterium]